MTTRQDTANQCCQAQEENVSEPQPVEDDDSDPRVAGEATSAINDMLDLHHNDDSADRAGLEELVSTTRQGCLSKLKRTYNTRHCTKLIGAQTDIKPLHMFVSGVGGMGKSFLIKTIRALMSKIWDYKTGSPVCSVIAPMGLTAFNVGGVTIHRLLQLPIEHDGKTAGYWKLGKEALKVMRNSLSQLRLLIIDEVSMVSSLNLAYIHLCLDEIFAKDEWLGCVNVLFVGDILQLPTVNG